MSDDLSETIDELFRVFGRRLRTPEQIADFNRHAQSIFSQRLGALIMVNSGSGQPTEKVIAQMLAEIRIGLDAAFGHHLATCKNRGCLAEDTYQRALLVVDHLSSSLMKGEEK